MKLIRTRFTANGDELAMPSPLVTSRCPAQSPSGAVWVFQDTLAPVSCTVFGPLVRIQR